MSVAIYDISYGYKPIQLLLNIHASLSSIYVLNWLQIMKIQNHSGASITRLSMPAQAINDKNQLNASPINQDNISLSELGKVSQKIDALFEEVDKIYMTQLSADQKQLLEESYSKLGSIFNKNLSDSEFEKKANAVFAKIDDIFAGAERKLSQEEKEKLNALNEQIDSLLSIEEEHFEQQMSNEVDIALQQRDELLISNLSANQKNELKSLNESLAMLFEDSGFTNADEVNKIFDKIDGILDASFYQLSEANRNKVNQLDSEIDHLFNEMYQFDTADVTYQQG